jgi:hypothetical protein
MRQIKNSNPHQRATSPLDDERGGIKDNLGGNAAPCLLSRRLGVLLSIATFVMVSSSSLTMIAKSYERSKSRSSSNEQANPRFHITASYDVATSSFSIDDDTEANITDIISDPDLQQFKEHLSDIHGLLKASYDRILLPWKVNENVSVTVQEDGFGGAIIRVR